MSDDNELRPGDAQRDQGANSGEQAVPEQSEPMSLLDDMGEPRFDVAGVALGAVSPEEAAEVRAAAAADAQLAAELAAMREVVAELSRVEPLEMINRGRSAGIRSRLIGRASASRAGRPPARPSSPVFGSSGSAAGTEQASMSSSASAQRGAAPLTVATTGAGMNQPRSKAGGRTEQNPEARQESQHDLRHEPRHESRYDLRGASRPAGRSWEWLALAASIAFAAAATQLWRVSNQRNEITGAVASRQTTLAEKVNQLEASVAARDSVIAALTGTSTRVIDLASYSSLAPMGRVFWDQKSEQWTMYAKHLKQPAAGKTYQLWLITKGNPAPISAGTFTPDPAGSAVMHAKYALASGTLQRIAVTEEPDGGVPAPTGPVLFVGAGK